MDAMLREQFAAMLDSLSGEDPWPALIASGFLDLLTSDGATLDGLFDIALECGRRPNPPRIVETILARLRDPAAVDIADPETSLVETGVAAELAHALASAAAAAQMVGAMQALLEMTIDYAGTRQQFGRPIAKFQAIQQQLATAVEEVHAAHVAAEAALTGPPSRVDRRRVAAAKIRAGKAADNVAAIAHAVHGAISISAEHDLHHFTRRLHHWRMAHGGAAWWAERLGQYMLNEPADFITIVRGLSTT
jgi:hypothetical protein